MHGPTPALFAALFAAQAGLLSLGPILPDVAREFGVTPAAAGQLRTLGGLGGGAAAIAVAVLGPRLGLRRMLIAGHSMLALGTIASATAPNLMVLAAAQATVGAAAGLLIAGALAATAAWTEPARRARALAVASLGQPISWVIGMPLGGLLAEIDWRYSVIGVPLVAAVAGVGALGRFAPPARSTSRGRALRTLPAWAVPELFSYAAWSGVLVFAGALLVESYSVSPGVAGLLLGAVALAALPGNVLARPWLSGYARELLVVLGLAAALLTVLFGTVRPSPAASTGILALLVLVACTRTVAGSAFALQSSGDRRLAAMGVRAATGQFGYLLGAAVGGAALAAGGYELLAVALAALFALGTVPHLARIVVPYAPGARDVTPQGDTRRSDFTRWSDDSGASRRDARPRPDHTKEVGHVAAHPAHFSQRPAPLALALGPVRAPRPRRHRRRRAGAGDRGGLV